MRGEGRRVSVHSVMQRERWNVPVNPKRFKASCWVHGSTFYGRCITLDAHALPWQCHTFAPVNSGSCL